MRINCLSELVLLVLVIACGVRSAPLISDVNANITSRLFEGDIAGYSSLLPNGTGKTLAIIPGENIQLWEDGIVYYTIKEDDYEDQEQIDNILAGMRMIEDQTRVGDEDCITFQERDSEDNYLNIISGDGCYSYVGRFVEPGPQELSLGAGGCTWAPIAAHELMHALGFEHEHNRPDRDQYITIMWDNLKEEHRPIFEKYTENVDTMRTPYDFNSIMQYGAYDFAMDESKPVIVPKKSGVKIPEIQKLSKYDIQSVRKLYGCV